MTHTPPRSSDSSRVLALALGLGLVAIPELAHAQPEEDDEIIEDDEYDDLEGSDAEEEYDDPLEGEDEEEAPGASASGSASGSVSLGGGGKGKAKGKAKRSKKDKGDKKPKEKDERPFFERYRPTNHMINAGFHLGGFWRANNHGLFDRSEGPQPSIRRGNFDFGFHLEYMVIPYVGVGFESSIMPTSSDIAAVCRISLSLRRSMRSGRLPAPPIVKWPPLTADPVPSMIPRVHAPLRPANVTTALERR